MKKNSKDNLKKVRNLSVWMGNDELKNIEDEANHFDIYKSYFVRALIAEYMDDTQKRRKRLKSFIRKYPGVVERVCIKG